MRDNIGLPVSAAPPAYSPDRYWGAWRNYQFNFSGAALPCLREVNCTHDFGLRFERVAHFLCYLMVEDLTQIQGDVVQLDEPVIILNLSTTNSAHSICEILSFVNFYSDLDKPPRIAISSLIEETLPFLYQLVGLLVSQDRILVLDHTKIYSVREAWFRRNTHFNPLVNWAQVPFYYGVDHLVFRHLGLMEAVFEDNPSVLYRKSREIMRASARESPRPCVMLAKTTEERYSATPGRAIVMLPEVRERLERGGISVLSVAQFHDIHDYICTLQQAKVFITSYGGAACTNRFFLSKECRSIVICNQHYRDEYNLHQASGIYWHLRHSHLAPIEQQHFLLDYENTMTMAEADKIVSLAHVMLNVWTQAGRVAIGGKAG